MGDRRQRPARPALGRCDIKSTGLLAQVLAKQAAREAGAQEAILVDGEGRVTEGGSSTIWMVDADGVLRTRHLDHAILPGCTRGALLALIGEAGLQAEEGGFTVDALRAAREVFSPAPPASSSRSSRWTACRSAPGGRAGHPPAVRSFRKPCEIRTTNARDACTARCNHSQCCSALRELVPVRVVTIFDSTYKQQQGVGMANEKSQNVQDVFLNHVRKGKAP